MSKENTEIIDAIFSLKGYIESGDRETMDDYLENHPDEKEGMEDAIYLFEQILTWS